MRFWVWSFPGAQDSHDRCLTCLGIQHMAESLCLCRDVVFVLAPGVALHPVESEVIEGHGEGFPRGVPHPSSAPQPVGLPLEWAGISAERGTPPVSFGASPDDQMSIAASEGELSLSGDDDPAALPPSGVVALSEPDPEMTAMLSRAAENVGLVWKKKKKSTASRSFEAGRVVSRWGSRWFSVPPSGAILPGSA